MNILTLSIKQKYFDAILAGTKKQEFREILPHTQKKYLALSEEYGILIPRKYDVIKFLTGAYTGKRPYMYVEIKYAHIEILCDKKGREITYEFNGKKYVAAQIIYDLGKIISCHEQFND